jgi:NRPS condensation-like uncharacterized protein
VLAVLAARPQVSVRRAAAGRWQRSSRWEHAPVLDTDPVRVLAWADQADLAGQRAAFLSESPALDQSPPVRFLLAAGPDSDHVILNAHHAVLDGLSCLGLLRAVASQYSESIGTSTGDTWPDADVSAGGRGVGHLVSKADVRAVEHPVSRADDGAAGHPVSKTGGRAARARAAQPGPGPAADDRAAARVRRFGPIARIAGQPDSAVPGPRPGYGACLLTWDEMPVAADRLRPLGASVNDLLITAMMITISRWNDCAGRSAGRIRITMPVGDRILQSADGAWGNGSRLTAVTARAPAGAAVSDLLAEVARQTRYAKEHPGPQVDLASRALAAAPVPVSAKRQLLAAALRVAGPLFCDTSLVSNLGIVEPLWFGPLPVTGIWFSTSAHMPRGLSLGAVTVGSRLGLAFRYRHELLADAAAAEFARLYLGVLSSFADRESSG